MLVKIIKCDNSNYWYHKYIGQIFDVFEEEESDIYVVKYVNSDTYLVIEHDDVEIFDRNKKIKKILDRNKNND